MNDASPATSPESCEAASDRLTIRRLLLLTAGVAVGLTLFAPRFEEGGFADFEQWCAVANAAIIGLALPAPLFCFFARSEIAISARADSLRWRLIWASGCCCRRR